MANPRINVDVDLSKMERKFGAANMRKAKMAVANQAMLDMNRLVPRRRGNLRASGHVTSAGNVEYSTLYARAQFYGRQGSRVFLNYTTPGTGKRWDLKAKVIYGDKWGRVVARSITK